MYMNGVMEVKQIIIIGIQHNLMNPKLIAFIWHTIKIKMELGMITVVQKSYHNILFVKCKFKKGNTYCNVTFFMKYLQISLILCIIHISLLRSIFTNTIFFMFNIIAPRNINCFIIL